MRIRLVLLSVLVGSALVLSSCGGSGSSGDDASGDKDSAATTKPDGGDDGGGKGDVDCEAIATAQADLLTVQLMAQIRDPQSLVALKSGTVGNLDLDRFQESMETLHQLDGYDSPLGDPKDAIDSYQQAATDVQALLESDAPTQADIDAYNESIGSVPEFLSHQSAIAGALDSAGC